MPWHTNELSQGNLLIETENNVVIGSVVLSKAPLMHRWHVEIMFTGLLGDYHFECLTYEEALSFIQGVEQAQLRCLHERSRL